jgi:hypothetical protein
MNLTKLIAVSGRPGIYRMVANRSNGLILEDLDSGKRFFVSGRMHQFTPLESISIYTEYEEEEDTVNLGNVFRRMIEQMDTNPPVSTKAKSPELRKYFLDIMPEHDQERVLNSDIKKIIKWFSFLNERNLLSLEEEPAETTEEDNSNTEEA